MEMHIVANLATLSLDLVTFFHKKRLATNLVTSWTYLIRFLRLSGTTAQARGLAFPACTNLDQIGCIKKLCVAQRQTNVINVHFACLEEASCPVNNVNRLTSKLLRAKKYRNPCFFFFSCLKDTNMFF